MAEYPKDVKYLESHEWIRLEGNEGTIGISDYAQEELNDVVYVELPEIGETFQKGEVFATVESVKAASDVYMPMSGTIIAVNGALADSPQLVNQDPYGAGWFVKIRISNPNEYDDLLDAEAYRKICEEQAAKGGH